MTSRQPYWYSKTKKRQPYWCTKLILWELDSVFEQTFFLFQLTNMAAGHVSENALFIYINAYNNLVRD